jgi:serine/threonine protein kinase
MIHQMMNKDPKMRPTASQLLSDPLFENIKKQNFQRLQSKIKMNQSFPKLKSHSMKCNLR